MQCENCGEIIDDDSNYCINCGEKIDNTNYFNDSYVENDDKIYDEPITTWGYVLYDLIYMIPIFGIIYAIIMAINSKNINVKNYMIYMLLTTLVVLILFMIMLMMGIKILP